MDLLTEREEITVIAATIVIGSVIGEYGNQALPGARQPPDVARSTIA
jgi:hypothetical protein